MKQIMPGNAGYVDLATVPIKTVLGNGADTRRSQNGGARKIALMDEGLSAIEERDNNLYRVYFNSAAISNEERRAGLGGVNRYKDLEDFNNSDKRRPGTLRII